MRTRWLLVITVAAAFAAPRPLQAQQGSIGTRSAAPTRPGGVRPTARQPATHIRIRPGAIALSASRARAHSRLRVCVFRSTAVGLFALDPYWWLAPDVIDDDVDVAALPVETPSPGSRPKGGLQLDVEPRRALVYLDGVLAGTVDQFKGYFDHLETTAGFHVVEFVAADYDPLIATVTVAPDRTTTYRAFLNRAAGR